MNRSGLSYFQLPIVQILILLVLGILIYSNTLQAPFVFDDTINIVDSPAIRDLAELLPLKPDSGTSLYSNRYVGYLSFALNYRFSGLHVAGYHVVNILIHLINALLVYWLVRLTFRTPCGSGFLEKGTARLPDAYGWMPWFIALVFVAHPIQTQAVTYIVQRFASLATLFYLLAVALYVKARITASSKRARYAFYVASVIATVLAMRTKEIAFTVPVMIVLWEWMLFEGDVKRRLLRVLPFLLTLLIIPLTLLGREGAPVGFGGIDELTRLVNVESVSRGDYLITQFRVIVTYLRLLCLPVGQNLDYDYPVYRSFFNPAVLASFMLLVAVFGLGLYLCWKSCRTRDINRFWLRWMALGIFWFLVTLSVESSIFPIVDVIFEHRLYLPSIGFFMAIVTAGMVVLHKVLCPSKNWSGIGDDSGSTRKMLVLILMAAVIALSAATYARNRVWRNETTLWEDVVRKSPRKARPRNNLGVAYQNQGRLEEALAAYRTAIRLKPDYADAYNNMGVSHKRQGHLAEAITAYERATRLSPNFAEAHSNLGVAYQKQGREAEAITAYERAIRLRPDFEEVHYNLGLLYAKQGRLEEAFARYQAAIRRKPDYAEAHYGLGVLHEKQGHWDEAIASYQAALRCGADFAEAYNNLGVLYAKKGRSEEAIKAYERAIRLDPDLAPAHNNLGVLYRKQGRIEEAIAAYQTALRLKPEFVEALNNLGMACSQQGRLPEAIAAYERAIGLEPDLAATHNNLGVLYEKQGRWKDAIHAYQTAIRLKPDVAATRYNLGVLYQKKGRLEEACREYQAVLKIDPDRKDARKNLEALERAVDKNTD